MREPPTPTAERRQHNLIMLTPRDVARLHGLNALAKALLKKLAGRHLRTP